MPAARGRAAGRVDRKTNEHRRQARRSRSAGARKGGGGFGKWELCHSTDTPCLGRAGVGDGPGRAAEGLRAKVR
jgi:hypothetical protein